MSLRLWWRFAGVPQSTMDIVFPDERYTEPGIAMVNGLRQAGFEAGLIKINQSEEKVV